VSPVRLPEVFEAFEPDNLLDFVKENLGGSSRFESSDEGFPRVNTRDRDTETTL